MVKLPELPFKNYISAVCLVLANMVPVFGVIFLDWKIADIMMLIWMENVIIGVINVLKILTQVVIGSGNGLGCFIYTVVFVFTYGMFCYGQGDFLVSFFTLDSFDLEKAGGLLYYTLFEMDLWIAAAALFASYFVSFLVNYILLGEYKLDNGEGVLFRPWERILVLSMTIILGMGFITATGQSVGSLAVLIIFKIYLDLLAHCREYPEVAKKLQPLFPKSIWESGLGGGIFHLKRRDTQIKMGNQKGRSKLNLMK